MIIDSHIHMGKFGCTSIVDMSPEVILQSMEKYSIDYAIFSNIEGIEVSSEGELLKDETFRNQKDVNEVAIEFARRKKDKLGVLLWARPLLEGCDKSFEDLIVANLDVVKGIKIHPFHSQLEFDDPKMEPYLELCRKYSLPCLVHSAIEYSSPKIVYEVAKNHEDIVIVMGHMGLGTDNMEAAQLIAKQPNLYGDTAWVSYEKVKELIKVCGADKILFGTDSPIDGVDTYGKELYQSYFEGDGIDNNDYKLLMCENAKKIFSIK
ncbi:MAG: amidohydrolase family protein [Eubacteriales bacterium]